MFGSNNRMYAKVAVIVTAAGLATGVLAQEKKTPPPAPSILTGAKAAPPAAAAPAKAVQPPAAGGAPVADPATMPEGLKIEAPAFDWGIIPDTAKVEHGFAFTNISGETIKIAVSASCGCTVVGLEKNTYAPGEAGTITGIFDPHGRGGKQTKTLTMTVIEPQGKFKQQQMTLSAEVRPLVQVEPIKTYLSEVDRKNGQTAKLVFTGRKEGFQITTIESPNEHVKWTLGAPRLVEENGEKLTKIDVDLTVGVGAPIGNMQAQMTISTNDERVAPMNYFVGADVVGDVRSNPPTAMLRPTNPNTPFSTEVKIDSRTNTPFTITSIDVDAGQTSNMVADVRKTPDGTGYMVVISGVTGLNPGVSQGAVTLTTEGADAATIRIPFSAVVRRPVGK